MLTAPLSNIVYDFTGELEPGWPETSITEHCENLARLGPDEVTKWYGNAQLGVIHPDPAVARNLLGLLTSFWMAWTDRCAQAFLSGRWTPRLLQLPDFHKYSGL